MLDDIETWIKCGLSGMATCMCELCYLSEEVHKCQYICKESEKPHKRDLLTPLWEQFFCDIHTCDCVGNISVDVSHHPLRSPRK